MKIWEKFAFFKKFKIEMGISSNKWSRIIVTSSTGDVTIVKFFLTILGVFKKVVLAVIMQQFENLRKIAIFKKNGNLKWKCLSKEWKRIIVTSFTRNKTIVKISNLAILDFFKISSLGSNYAAIWKFEKYSNFFKNARFEMGISSRKMK